MVNFENKTLDDAWGINESSKPESAKYIEPFFNLDYTDDDAVKEWADTSIPILQDLALDFSRRAIENTRFYRKGMPSSPDVQFESFQDVHEAINDNQISFNIIYEFVELWVNRLGNFKPEINVQPSTDDSKARDNADAKKKALQHFFKVNKLEQLFNTFDRQCFTLGEAYMYASWDPDKGPLKPGFEEIRDKFKNFKKVKTKSGDTVNVDRFPRIGDVKVQVIPGIYVLFENKPWEDLDYIIIELKNDINKLRSDHPKADLEGSGEVSEFHLYHLPTKYLQEGRYVKMSCGEVLRNEPYPIDKAIFPVTRMTNIDMVGAGRAYSFIDNIKPHQILINETISEVWNNLRRTSKGKWVVPAKTVNLRHLDPNSPGVEYYGNVKPDYITYESIKSEAIRFIELIREYAEKQARIQGIVQGAPPPNVRSGLQFAQLEEQEKKSVEITVNKKYRSIEEIGEVVAALMAKNYKPEDNRTVTLFGKDKEYLTEALNVSALSEDHPVEVVSDDMPAGKMSQLSFYADLRQTTNPNVVPDELFIDMLDSGRFNQYTEFAGATVETTLAQISKAIDGEQPEPPQEYEDLILKWKIVVGTMRKRSFLSYDENVRQIFRDMVETIEELIMAKPAPTPLFQEQLQTLDAFPIYYREARTQFAEDMMGMPPVAPEGAGMGGEEPMMDEQALMEGGDVPLSEEELLAAGELPPA